VSSVRFRGLFAALHSLHIRPASPLKGDPYEDHVRLDDELVRQAQEFTGIIEKTALLREALKALIHREASHQLAALGGTMPELEDIKRLRVDRL
jgi:Arc/MetJ family transcription regulator